MMIFSKEDVSRVIDELRRRIDLDLQDGTLPHNAKYIQAEISSRLQGVYGTIMAVVPNKNWQDVVWWLDEELNALDAYYGLK